MQARDDQPETQALNSAQPPVSGVFLRPQSGYHGGVRGYAFGHAGCLGPVLVGPRTPSPIQTTKLNVAAFQFSSKVVFHEPPSSIP